MKIAIQTNVWSAAYHQDLPALLSEIRSAGYDGFEIGAHRLDLSRPGVFAELLASSQLAVAGLHIHGELHNPPSVEPLYDFYTQAAKFAAAVAAPFILISGKPKQSPKTELELASELQVLQRLSKICTDHGLSLGYHNHYWELEQGCRELDYLVSHSSPNDFGLALDIAWVHRAGYQPAKIIHTYRERIKYLHIKDTLSDRFTDLGEGQVDLVSVKHAIQSLSLPWLTVERDEVLPDALHSAQACREYLRNLFA
jgi:sugar phosphate isomerase/epimerase